MALQFKPSDEQKAEVVETTATQVSSSTSTDLEVKQNFDIVVKTEELKQDLIKSEEISKLVSTINVNEPNTVVTFGSEVANEISKVSDQVLNSMNLAQINDSGTMLVNLSKIMEKFDIEEIKDDDDTGFKRLFKNMKKSLDQLLAKYHSMGDEVDKIYVQLKGYEKEIGESNVKLENLFNANIDYYKQLLKYIMAGDQALVELDEYIVQYRAKLEAEPTSGTIQMDLNSLEQVRDILDQRVMDLKIAENVALQTIPMLKAMEFSNLNLIRKINSAFIVTMPVFKQALAQAVMLKRQRIQSEAMKALDDKTNEMLIKNAQNTVAQTKMTTRLAAGSSIKVETLEQTWQTIVTGIEETRQIQDEMRQKRKEDSVRLQRLNDDFKTKMHA